jgi:hypothetical protein
LAGSRASSARSRAGGLGLLRPAPVRWTSTRDATRALLGGPWPRSLGWRATRPTSPPRGPAIERLRAPESARHPPGRRACRHHLPGTPVVGLAFHIEQLVREVFRGESNEEPAQSSGEFRGESPPGDDNARMRSSGFEPSQGGELGRWRVSVEPGRERRPGRTACPEAILRRPLVVIDAVANSKAVIYSFVSMNGPSVISTCPLRRRTVAASTTPGRS